MSALQDKWYFLSHTGRTNERKYPFTFGNVGVALVSQYHNFFTTNLWLPKLLNHNPLTFVICDRKIKAKKPT